jgi:hypothetical protein
MRLGSRYGELDLRQSRIRDGVGMEEVRQLPDAVGQSAQFFHASRRFVD